MDPALRSWVDVPADSHFPIQNLPYGVFLRRGGSVSAIGVAIGDHILDLTYLEGQGLLGAKIPVGLFHGRSLNLLLAAGPAVWEQVRSRVIDLLRADNPELRDDCRIRPHALVPMEQVEMRLPVQIAEFTDFYSSRYHATNVGTMLRGPDNALNPNWLHLPVAYHGRASSVVVSGTSIRRPCGQTSPSSPGGDGEKPLISSLSPPRGEESQLPPTAGQTPLTPGPSPPTGEGRSGPSFGPSRALDFELEMGFFVGPGNCLGEPIPIDRAADHIFGMVLVNDWSARDIQKWEYQPLGPFLAKNFATSISPWVVPIAALEPFRCPGPRQDPVPLPYLCSRENWHFDIILEVWLQTSRMDRPQRLAVSNFKHLYWNMAQQLAHHTVNGCPMRPGDLLVSGTISGPTPDSLGCLLELAWKGTRPILLSSGETRTFLQDGDRVTFTGWCQGDGYRVGFGEVAGTIQPSRDA